MGIPINWWAILASLVSSVVLGMIWYGPLFGKQWMALSGIVMPDPKPPMSVMVRPIILSLIGAFILSVCLAHSIVYAGAFMQLPSGVMLGIEAAFWNWLGFVVPVQLNYVAWENKPWALFFIHSGYWLVLLGIMGMIIATWK